MNLLTFAKRAVKAALPYGVIALRRRFLKQNEVQARRELYADAVFKETFLKTVDGKRVFDFNGALLPDISQSAEKLTILRYVFSDTFLFPVYFHDDYDKSVVRVMDLYMAEGPYGYTDGADDANVSFDVTVKPGDVVIDAGAWIGDFSAYAAAKGAEVYAFEPTTETFRLLEETAALNKPALIHPVKKGLGASETSVPITIYETNSGGNSILAKGGSGAKREMIDITTLDAFVSANNLPRVDFIKADIEGAERDMLRGAAYVLKTFAPRLAMCTYHLPDDPEVLEALIKEANPRYKVVHLRKKLFAAVV
jgi:FkbM family methyltransferase